VSINETTIPLEWLTPAIAVLALLLSAGHIWVSQFWRGRVFLTQPMIFYFGWDDRQEESVPKIMLRAALFSEGVRGQVVEALSILVKNADGEFEFALWGYDEGHGLMRGSGIFIGSAGHIAYHHFNPVDAEHTFAYSGTDYEVKVLAKLFGRRSPTVLGRYQLSLDQEIEGIPLAHGEVGVIWNWSMQEDCYYREVSRRPTGKLEIL